MDLLLSRNRSPWIIAKLLTSVAAAVAILYCVAGFSNQNSLSRREFSSKRSLKRTTFHLPSLLLSRPISSRLLDLEKFEYTLNSAGCEVANVTDYKRFAMIVHSKPEHFRQRQVIRKTWASISNIRTVFLLGITQPSNYVKSRWRPDIPTLVEAEHKKYGDLVQGNFVDNYRNLTYKHLMGLRWITENCNKVDYVIKADDDAFVNTIELNTFLQKVFPEPPVDTLICSVFQEGSEVLRSGKYSVSESEFPWKTYPKFCSGLGYVTTPSLVRKLLQASEYIPSLHIDDVYVTGLLAEAVSAKYFYLNLRYAYDGITLKHQWKHVIFGELDTTLSDWRETAESLWKNVRRLDK